MNASTHVTMLVVSCILFYRLVDRPYEQIAPT